MAVLKSRGFAFRVGGKNRDVSLLIDETGKSFIRGGKRVGGSSILEAKVEFLGRTIAVLTLGNERSVFQVENTPEGLRLVHEGDLCLMQSPSDVDTSLFAQPQGSTKIAVKSQIPGLVVALHVKENQWVKEGETLLVIEAMKMQNPVKAPFSGKIKRLFASAGMSVEAGIALVELERIKS